MLAEPRRLGIGRLTVHGHDLAFEPAPAEFAVRPDEELELMLLFDYREVSRDQEHVRISFAVELDGVEAGAVQREIGDRPLASDDAWSYMTVRLPRGRSGRRTGRFRITARYARGEWHAPASDEWVLEREGDFVLDVAAPRQHRL